MLYLIALYLIIYVMGLRPLWMFNSFSAGIDFRRQILTGRFKLKRKQIVKENNLSYVITPCKLND